MSDNLDFNNVGPQRSFDIIPDNTVCALHMRVKPGGAGPDGWLTRSKDGTSEHLNCELTVIGRDYDQGKYNKRKIFVRLTVNGHKHAEAVDITRKTLGAMLESARNIRPDDKSSAAVEGRRVRSYGEFDGLCFIGRLGVEPPKNGYAAKNTIKKVITPDEKEWRRPEPPPPGSISSSPGPAPGGSGGAAATAPQSGAAPANAITRPDWAKPQHDEDK